MKISSETNLLADAKQALKDCLTDVPFCRVEFGPAEGSLADRGFDVAGRFLLRDGQIPFVIETKSIGQPRFVREAAYTLNRYRSRRPDTYPIFIAPFVANDAAKILEAEGMGYVDLSGNCRLCFDEVYVRCTGNENKFIRRRGLRSLFSPKSERVLRILLDDPARSWKVQDLAREAGISLGQVSNVKRKLEDREWASRVESGLRLSKPDRVLFEWKDNYNLSRSERRDFFTLSRVDEFEQRLASLMKSRASRSRTGYALTAFSAAARYAPAVRYQRVYAYVSENISQLAQELELKPVESGANVTLITPYDEGVYIGSTDKRGVKVTSPIQSYLDLSQLRGRGEEAAETLLREAIEPKWR